LPKKAKKVIKSPKEPEDSKLKNADLPPPSINKKKVNKKLQKNKLLRKKKSEDRKALKLAKNLRKSTTNSTSSLNFKKTTESEDSESFDRTDLDESMINYLK
jgi:hypothetical protein